MRSLTQLWLMAVVCAGISCPRGASSHCVKPGNPTEPTGARLPLLALAPIQIYGQLTEPAWQQATNPRRLSFPWSQRPPPATTFRAFANAQRLFFAFDVSDDDLVVEKDFPSEPTVDGEDRAEIFFARDAALEKILAAPPAEPLSQGERAF